MVSYGKSFEDLGETMPQNYRKRRHAASENKNELKISRNEDQRRRLASSGTLRERYPNVRSLAINMRMESVSGAVLDSSERTVGLDEPLDFNVPCQGGCSGGVFLLSDAIAAALSTGQEQRDGLGICQMSSYRDPTVPCSTKFYYRVTVDYAAE
jgi:hypothetical protein